MKGFLKIAGKSVISSIAATALLALSSTVYAQGGMAMTWVNKKPDAIGNGKIVSVGCSAGCDAYKGDTKTSAKLRILCIVPGNAPAPAKYTNYYSTLNKWKFYHNWSGAKIGLTKKVKGTTLTSRAVADKICKTDLKDDKARMIEHHDNKVGGWNVGGLIHPNSVVKGPLKKVNLVKNPNTGKYEFKKVRRFWASIKGQPANPWD